MIVYMIEPTPRSRLDRAMLPYAFSIHSSSVCFVPGEASKRNRVEKAAKISTTVQHT